MKKRIFLLAVLILFQMTVFNQNMVFAKSFGVASQSNVQKAVAYYKQGINLLKQKKYEDAISYFESALKYNPKMTDAYYNIASAYVSQKRYDEAYDTYVKVIALNPYDYDSILQAAKISYNRQNYTLAMKYLRYIPDDYSNYKIVKQLYKDSMEQFNLQKSTIERSKITKADETKKVLIDELNAPAGIVVDSQGYMYVACYNDNSIVKIDADKKKTVFVKDNLIEGPIGLAMDAYDNLYVANYDANNILKITKSGNITEFMENVLHPYFLYIKDDILYISEQGNDVVIKYNLK